ncbi:MAG: hypothetical protein V2J20_01815 [Wenzhouxiangella sp.]|jgi:hypothetical protein|nr:hypothetical protein [Wenzhouxiangella sp.]
MGYRLSDAEQQLFLGRVRQVLTGQQGLQSTLTYLELADKVAIPAPQRIHRVTRLLEKTMKEDAEAGQPLQAALVVSRLGDGLPAEGFFDRARRLGVFKGRDAQAFHRSQLQALFARSVLGNCTASAKSKSDSL